MAATTQNLCLPFDRPVRRDELMLPPFVRKGDPFDKYVDIDEAGCGAFGIVYRAKARSDGNLIAIKVLEAPSHQTDNYLKALNEVTIGMQMQHPNIVQTHEVWYDGTRFFIMMDLVTLISISELPESPKNKFILFQQLVSAVAYLHSKGFLHRDIKVQNTGIKLSKNGKMQLALFDFGEACEKSYDSQKCVGTILNIAPEILKIYKYSESSEMWALMCFIVEFLTRKPLILHFFDSRIGARALDVKSKIHSFTEPPIPEVFKTDKSRSGLLLLQILKRGLAIDPEERLTFPELEALLLELLELL